MKSLPFLLTLAACAPSATTPDPSPPPVVLDVPAAFLSDAPNTLTLQGLASGRRAYLVASVADSGSPHCPPQTAPACFDLYDPAGYVGPARADSSGTATWTLNLPPQFSATSGTIQAVTVLPGGSLAFSDAVQRPIVSASGDEDGDGISNADELAAGTDLFSGPDLDAMEDAVWNAYLASTPSAWSTSTPTGARLEQTLEHNGATMRYTVERRGSATGPQPLYIALHGGGGAPASVNDSQWRAMQTYYRDSVASGLYVTPRGITNNWNLHFDGNSYPLYDQLIERMIVQEDVDPDRVYLLGFSAGGDGVYQVAPRLADRFAAANMSAGHPNGTPADNLANVPYLLQMGEFDTAYNRHTQAALYAQQLDGLETAYPGLYTHDLFLHLNGSHNSWSDRDPSGGSYPVIADYDAWLAVGDRTSMNVDSNAISWLDDHIRDPWPPTVIWALGTRAGREGREVSNYWLSVDPAALGSGRIEADYDPADNSVTLDATGVPALTVNLNHHMLDLAQPVIVRVDGTETTLTVVPDQAHMEASVALRGDPRQLYSAAIEVDWSSGAAVVTTAP